MKNRKEKKKNWGKKSSTERFLYRQFMTRKKRVLSLNNMKRHTAVCAYYAREKNILRMETAAKTNGRKKKFFSGNF